MVTNCVTIGTSEGGQHRATIDGRRKAKKVARQLHIESGDVCPGHYDVTVTPALVLITYCMGGRFGVM